MTDARATVSPVDLKFIPQLTCSISVSDYAASVKWYSEKLGFKFLYETPEIGWSELETIIPGVSIGLSQVEQVTPCGSVVLTFGVQDVQFARTQLEMQGVRFDGESQVVPGLVKLATFFDPDGNPFMLAESLTGQS